MIKGNEKWRAPERERLRISYGKSSAHAKRTAFDRGKQPSYERIAPLLMRLLVDVLEASFSRRDQWKNYWKRQNDANKTLTHPLLKDCVMKKSAEKVGQLLNYEKLSGISLLGLPKVEKKDVPNYIHCPKYEKAKGKLDSKMERYRAKVDRCVENIRNSNDNIADMKRKRDLLDPGFGFFVDKTSPRAVARYNDRLIRMRSMQAKIDGAIGTHNYLVDERKEAEDKAKEALEELTLEALQAVDEDIALAVNRLEGIASNLANSDDTDDLLSAIDVCTIALRVYAMFTDLLPCLQFFRHSASFA